MQLTKISQFVYPHLPEHWQPDTSSNYQTAVAIRYLAISQFLLEKNIWDQLVGVCQTFMYFLLMRYFLSLNMYLKDKHATSELINNLVIKILFSNSPKLATVSNSQKIEMDIYKSMLLAITENRFVLFFFL